MSMVIEKNGIAYEALDLASLTVVAQEQYQECLLAIETALRKQIEFGRVLLIVKSKLPHGAFSRWVRETFTDLKSLRTIQRHMRGAEAIATDPSLLESAVSLDSLLKKVEAKKPSVKVIETSKATDLSHLTEDDDDEDDDDYEDDDDDYENLVYPRYMATESMEEADDREDFFEKLQDDIRLACSRVPSRYRHSLVQQALERLSKEDCRNWPDIVKHNRGCVSIGDLIVDHEQYGHGPINQTLVDQYAALLQDAGEYSQFGEPILVYGLKQKPVLVDGFHRVAAMKQLGRDIIDVYAPWGDENDAFFSSRGIRLTPHSLSRTMHDLSRTIT